MSEPEVDAGVEAAIALLEAAPGDLGPQLAEADEAAAALRRQPLGALTALAWALPPETPPPQLRERLLARLSGDETQMVSAALLLGEPPPGNDLQPGAGTGAAARSATDGAAPLRAAERAAPRPGIAPAAGPQGGAGKRPAARPSPLPPRPAMPARRWAWPAVAALAAALIAAGALCLSLWRELEGTRERLRQQAADREALAATLAELERERPRGEELQGQLAALREQLALVTAVTTEVCPLRPPARSPVVPDARGLLYVAADHQHWYLRAQGLQPPGDGRVYHLWFVVGDTPVSAGSFTLDGEEAALTSPTMPEGTRAALVTVEPESSLGERPSGPVVLYGSELSRLL